MNRSTVFLISFFTALLTAVGVSFLMPRLLQPHEPAQQQVTVPSLIGLTETDARANLQSMGLVMMVGGQEADAKATPGTVTRQSLPVGQRIAPGQPVSVTLAVALPKVPDVAGRTVQDATRMLEEAGYAVQVGAPLPDPSVPKGAVASQSPKGGTALAAQSSVVLQPSAGPDVVEVPKVVGVNLTKAKADLEKAGFKVGPVKWVILDETPAYLVIRQSPDAGQKVSPGSTLTLTVNTEE